MRFNHIDAHTRSVPKVKYRPVLTAEQITHILHLAKTESPISNASISVISVLAPFEAKILNAGIKPAYTEAPKKDILESLGGRTPAQKMADPPRITSYPTDSASSASSPVSTEHLTKEQRWEAAYNKWSTNPSSCSLQEIKDAQEHRYLNDLMSPEEMVEFELSATGDL